MAKRKKRPLSRSWTAADLKYLRKHAGRKATSFIAQVLRRSPGALRFKAHIEGISLRLR